MTSTPTSRLSAGTGHPRTRAAPRRLRNPHRPRLPPHHRLRRHPLAQRHGHQLGPGAPARRGQLQLPPQRPGPHPGRLPSSSATPPADASPEFLLVTDTAQVEVIQQHLDKFIIMDDVELTPTLRPTNPASFSSAPRSATTSPRSISPSSTRSASRAQTPQAVPSCSSRHQRASCPVSNSAPAQGPSQPCNKRSKSGA